MPSKAANGTTHYSFTQTPTLSPEPLEKKKEEEDPTQYKLKLPVLLLLAEIGVQYTHSYLVCERCD